MIYNLKLLTIEEQKILRAKLAQYQNYDKLDLLIELMIKNRD